MMGRSMSVIWLTIFSISFCFPEVHDFVKRQTCSPTYSKLSSGLTLNSNASNVYAIASFQNVLFVGGEFTNAGGLPVNNIARWTGSGWFDVLQGANGIIYALTVFQSSLYLGGLFQQVDSISSKFIARWNGTHFFSVPNSFSGGSAAVHCLLTVGNVLYVGGSFSSPPYVSAYSGSTWSDLSTGLDDTVWAMSSIGNDLYVGGEFLMAGQYAASHVAKWVNGTWFALGDGVDGIVYALASIGTNLYVGGNFNTANLNTPARFIARWDGSNWAPLIGGLDATAFTFATFSNKLYVGGVFSSVGNAMESNRIATWDGASWIDEFEDGLGSQVQSLYSNGSELFIGGRFLTANRNANFNSIAKFSCVPTPPTPQPTPQPTPAPLPCAVSSLESLENGVRGVIALATWVYAIQIYQNSLYVGGVFSKGAGLNISNIAKWDGNTWNAVGPNPGENGNMVKAMTIYNGELIIGGMFSSISNQIFPNNIVRWNGSVWHLLSTGLDGSVNALAVFQNNLYAGGGFQTAGGTAANRIARWNGTNWFAVGSGFITGFVNVLFVFQNNLYIGGSFSHLSPNVVGWNGTNFFALKNGTDLPVTTFESFENELYLGGMFFNASGTSASKIAKWNGTDFSNLKGGMDGTVQSMLVLGNELLVSGDFFNVNSIPVYYNARWNGSDWNLGELELGGPLYDMICSNVTSSSGRKDCYLGGQFDIVNGISDFNNIFKYNVCFQTTSVPTPSQTNPTPISTTQQTQPTNSNGETITNDSQLTGSSSSSSNLGLIVGVVIGAILLIIIIVVIIVVVVLRKRRNGNRQNTKNDTELVAKKSDSSQYQNVSKVTDPNNQYLTLPNQSNSAPGSEYKNATNLENNGTQYANTPEAKTQYANSPKETGKQNQYANSSTISDEKKEQYANSSTISDQIEKKEQYANVPDSLK